MHTFLDFEKPIAELEGKIEQLRHLSDTGEVNIADEVGKLQGKVERQLRSIYGRLSPWQKVQVARHPGRPRFRTYREALVEEFIELRGDRAFADDRAIIGGIGRVQGYAAVVIGTEKGEDTETRIAHNFGMARPEGYRKAQRLMRLAERFDLPVITFVDTAGAYPGVDAEARGQAEAIARSIDTCLDIGVPLISVVIGEGGSGGAVALAVANKVLMLEHAVYSVISPEGCASILWRAANHVQDAADALKLTAQDLHSLGVVDRILPEPLGAAHRNPEEAVRTVGEALAEALRELHDLDRGILRARRREKFLEMGQRALT